MALLLRVHLSPCHLGQAGASDLMAKKGNEHDEYSEIPLKEDELRCWGPGGNIIRGPESPHPAFLLSS